MTVDEIYSRYKIPPNLQNHLLWVAGVGNIIANNWKEKDEIDVEIVTKTLLIHDTAKIVNFDFDKSAYLIGKEDIEFWKKAQQDFIKMHGGDEEIATINIAKELNLNKKGIYILDQMHRINLQNQISELDWELKICWYADFRVAPNGVTIISERLNELIKRSEFKGSSVKEIERLKGIKIYCLNLEKELQKKVMINLNSINQKQVEELIIKLKQINF